MKPLLRRTALAAGIAALATTVLTSLAAPASAAGTLVVSSGDEQGFVAQAYDCTANDVPIQQAFVPGPLSPPLGSGSRQFTLANDPNETQLYRTPRYDGILVSAISALQYSTFAQPNGSGVVQQAPYLRLSVDLDADLVRDESLFFIPSTPGNHDVNGAVYAEGVWQTWDAADAANVLLIDGDPARPTTLGAYATANPNARLVNNNANLPTGGAVALIVGCAGATQLNSTYNVDRLVFGNGGNVTTFDFEPGTQSTVVNFGNPSGFTAAAVDCTNGADLQPDQQFVFGPPTPPLGAGSRQLKMGTNAFQTEVYSTQTYDGLQLSQLSALQYSTYAAWDGNSAPQQPAYLRLTVNDGNGGIDTLYYVPSHNMDVNGAPATQNTWQTWNVSVGSLDLGMLNGPATTLAQYVALHPQASLVSRAVGPNKGGSISLMVGCFGAGQQSSTFNVDRLLVGTNPGGITVYDFEPTPANPPVPPPAPASSAPASTPPASTPPASSPPASQSSTPASSPTGTPNNTSPAVPCAVTAVTTVGQESIVAGNSGTVSVRTTPNSVIELWAYSRPSTTFRVVREAEVGDDGLATFTITPPTNTRLYAQQKGCAAGQSVVFNVRTALSIFAKRLGVRTYQFSGDSMPARAGGLIVSLYRVTATGSQVLTSQARASSSNGEWSLIRTFTGSGRFGFLARTGQDLLNAPGASAFRSTLIY